MWIVLDLFKGSRLVLLGLCPWVLGCVSGTLGDFIGSYMGYIVAMLGKPFSRGPTLQTLTVGVLHLSMTLYSSGVEGLGLVLRLCRDRSRLYENNNSRGGREFGW